MVCFMKMVLTAIRSFADLRHWLTIASIEGVYDKLAAWPMFRLKE